MGFDTYDGKSHKLLEAILKELVAIHAELTEARKTLDSIDDNTSSDGKRAQRKALRQSSYPRW